MKLTDRMIRGMKPLPGGRRRVVSDAGLEVVVDPGRKFFRARARVGGRTRYAVLGDYGDADGQLSLRVAREAANDWIRKQQRLARATRGDAATMTVKGLLDEWDDVFLRKERRHPDQPRRAIEKDVIPRIGDVRLADLTRRDLVLCLDAVVARGSPSAADHLRSTVQQMFSFAEERGLVDDSPARRLPKARRGKHAEARDRVLDDEELRRLWWALANKREDIPVKYQPFWFNRVRPYTKRALKLLLLTGTRRSEVVLAEWEEFSGLDTDVPLWTVPGERTKNGKALKVPLSDLAVEVLEEQRELTRGHRHVFASPKRDFERPILPSAVSQCVNDNVGGLVEDLERPPFTPHDLRRTLRSRVSALGVDVVVARKLLNHSLGGMDAIYDRHEYLAERRDALQRWADDLRRILRGDSNVVPFRAAR